MYIHQATENSKHLEKPYNQNDYNNNIQNFFDVVIHGDEWINKPKQDSNNNYYE